jgi:prepilin-type N-terminal cleavage/methylation domain-containing protein
METSANRVDTRLRSRTYALDAARRDFEASITGRDGFTLLEILIALALVAILMGAALPYLHDSFIASAGDRTAEEISALVLQTRNEAIARGESRRLLISSNGISGITLPGGWQLQLRGINDSRFHPPARDETWEFSSAGICQPLDLRISDREHEITLSFDALTGQTVHDR